MKIFTQISSIIVALLFVYTINFKSVLTFNYFVNQTEIAELFCINKEKPQLQCDGKCHLATQINLTEEDENESPFSGQTTNYNLEINPILVSDGFSANDFTKSLKKENTFYIISNPCQGFSSILAPPPKA